MFCKVANGSRFTKKLWKLLFYAMILIISCSKRRTVVTAKTCINFHCVKTVQLHMPANVVRNVLLLPSPLSRNLFYWGKRLSIFGSEIMTSHWVCHSRVNSTKTDYRQPENSLDNSASDIMTYRSWMSDARAQNTAHNSRYVVPQRSLSLKADALCAAPPKLHFDAYFAWSHMVRVSQKNCENFDFTIRYW